MCAGVGVDAADLGATSDPMQALPQIERELSAWAAARAELALAKRLASDDPASKVNDARIQRATEAVKETVTLLRAAMDARGISREQLQQLLQRN